MTAGEWVACYQDQVREETRARLLVVLRLSRYVTLETMDDSTVPKMNESIPTINGHSMRLKVNCEHAAKP